MTCRRLASFHVQPPSYGVDDGAVRGTARVRLRCERLVVGSRRPIGRRTLRSRPDRLPPCRDRCGRWCAPPFEARIAAARAAPSHCGRLDSARGHPGPGFRDRFGHRRGPAPRRCARTGRSRRHRRACGFMSGPRTRPSLPAARRSQALPQPSVGRLAPQRRRIRADPASSRQFLGCRRSSPPLGDVPGAACNGDDRLSQIERGF
jgi:hypothetical protein